MTTFNNINIYVVNGIFYELYLGLSEAINPAKERTNALGKKSLFFIMLLSLMPNCFNYFVFQIYLSAVKNRVKIKDSKSILLFLYI